MMEKARPVDLLAPIGGAMLLISAFLEWFRYPDPEVIKLQQQFEVPGQNIETPATLITSTAWEVTSLRYIIYLCAIAAIVNFFVLIAARTPGKSVVFSTPVILLASLTTIWIVIRWINPPFDDASALNGLYLGLAGAGLIFVGTLFALKDERIPSGFDHAPQPEMLRVPADLPSSTAGPAAAAGQPSGLGTAKPAGESVPPPRPPGS